MKFSCSSSAEAVFAVNSLSSHFDAMAALDDMPVFIPCGSVVGRLPTLDEIKVPRADGKGSCL
jgi:hypothetical protein